MDRRTAIALLVAGTFFMENLDGTVITPAIPHIAASFGIRPVDLNVGVSAYLLTLGVFIPVSGWIADRFGTRTVFASAIALFTIASVLCGLATTLPLFVLTRILQGMGGALMVPVGRLAVLRGTPREQLVTAIAMLTWPALVAPVLGPPVGGFIADRVDWRWIFYLNAPLGMMALALALHLVPNTRAPRPTAFDWLGFALSGLGLFCLLYAADLLARSTIAWGVTSLFALCGTILLALAVRHFLRAPAPMVRLSSLSVPTFAVTFWGGSLFRMGVSAVPFLVPLLYQVGFGFDAFHAGLLLMAVFAGNLLMKPLTTPILRRLGFRTVLVVNGAINAALIAACALIALGLPLPIACLILFAGGMSRSMQFTGLNTIAFSDIPKEGMTDANTLFSAVFQLAMGLGVAVAAIGWRMGETLAPKTPNIPFAIAFGVIALISATGILDSLRLDRSAGDVVIR